MIKTEKIIYKNALYILMLVFGMIIVNCNSSPIKIVHAKRAHKLTTSRTPPDQINSFEIPRTSYDLLTPVYPDSSVVLDLKIDGISIEEFNNIDERSIFILAEELRCIPYITLVGTVDGEKVIKLAFIVPIDIYELTLLMGSYPLKTFKVDKKISSELNDW